MKTVIWHNYRLITRSLTYQVHYISGQHKQV